MNASELAALIGQRGTIAQNGMKFEVEISNVKQTYGRVRYLVTPVSGSGSAWVESVSIPSKE